MRGMVQWLHNSDPEDSDSKISDGGILQKREGFQQKLLLIQNFHKAGT